jgi:hypothetical protein
MPRLTPSHTSLANPVSRHREDDPRPRHAVAPPPRLRQHVHPVRRQIP